jgi:hypothetical protein
MLIRVFKDRDSDPIDEIEVEGIDPSLVIPVNARVGDFLADQELGDLLQQTEPSKSLTEEEPDIYYAQGVSVWLDGEVAAEFLELPHYLGLRVALSAILRKYGSSDQWSVQIS